MMAQAIDWDDSATVSGQPVPADEAWHVAVAPDDVKVVSLEQLDDMFRLSLVDSETKVWQPGMSEWLALGVVAGLDDNPAPPKRTHPKPPSPRSAPPPPRRASLAPAPFYAEPLAQVSYATPLAPLPTFAPIASVRPLVVSHNPYPMPRSGGTFGRFVVGVALCAGVCITLYRNDVLRDAARSIHQEGLYTRLEQKLGGPSFGTLRAVEQSESAQAAAALTLSGVTGDGASAKTEGESAALANVVASPTPNIPPPTAKGTSNSPPVVSLESLGTEKRGAAVAAAVPAARVAAPSVVSAPVAKASPVAKAAPVVKALKAAPAEPEPKPVKAAPIEKAAPPPAATKPESEMTPRERLNAEIARSMQTSPASAKKSSKPPSTGLKGSGEYDPLNPKL